MLTISVKNFGPIAEGSVDLKPLTIFVGPSNTGKSYMATAVYAVSKAFQGESLVAAPDAETPMLPGGTEWVTAPKPLGRFLWDFQEEETEVSNAISEWGRQLKNGAQAKKFTYQICQK